MSNSRLIQSLLWALHNNYVIPKLNMVLRKHFKPYLSIGCVNEIFCPQNIKNRFFIEVFSAQNTVRLVLRNVQQNFCHS